MKRITSYFPQSFFGLLPRRSNQLEWQALFITELQVHYPFFFSSYFPFSYGRGYPNVCTPAVSTGGLLLGETSGTVEVQD